jgi:hypothetical protein
MIRHRSIYALCHPGTGEIRYIGQTVKPLNQRLNGHVSDHKNSHKTNWVNTLKAQGLRPVIQLLEEGDWTQEECDAREIEWIAWGRDGQLALTNIADGGRVNENSCSPEQRAAHSEFMKKWHAENPDKRRKAGIYNHSPSTKALISQTTTAQWEDPEKRERLLRAREGKTEAVWANMTEEQYKDRCHKLSLARRFTVAKKSNRALEVIS